MICILRKIGTLNIAKVIRFSIYGLARRLVGKKSNVHSLNESSGI